MDDKVVRLMYFTLQWTLAHRDLGVFRQLKSVDN